MPPGAGSPALNRPEQMRPSPLQMRPPAGSHAAQRRAALDFLTKELRSLEVEEVLKRTLERQAEQLRAELQRANTRMEQQERRIRMLERELQAEREARRTGAPMVVAPPEAAPMAPVGSNGGGGSSEAAPSGSPLPTPAEAGAEHQPPERLPPPPTNLPTPTVWRPVTAAAPVQKAGGVGRRTPPAASREVAATAPRTSAAEATDELDIDALIEQQRAAPPPAAVAAAQPAVRRVPMQLPKGLTLS